MNNQAYHSPAKMQSLNAYFARALRENFEMNAFSDYGGDSFTFAQVATEIARLHKIYSGLGIAKGDKIALIGKNTANWCMVYLSAITYGAVIVPILPDFRPDDMHEIVNHSDSVLLFSEDSIFKTLDHKSMPAIGLVLRIRDFSVLSASDDASAVRYEGAIQAFENAFPNGISPDDINYPDASPDDLLVISYTSGTTGFSKGVMIPHRSLLGNVVFARENMPLNAGDRILSFLPLAHAYGCAFEFLFPFTLGCHITFLARVPSPTIIVEAFGKVKPNLILSVPLVIEKIYRSKLQPVVSKPIMKFLLHVPGIKRVLLNKIKAKLRETLGGEFRELVIGGAAFNAKAESFFRKMRFPFTVGYGMTECGPLISYRSWNTTELLASGKVVDELEARIDSSDPENINGEILVRGNHVMLGYYKNPEATNQIIDKEGWLHTGDIGTIDKKGNIFIRGRMKNMILGSSGKNIYPEEIESVLSNIKLFAEVLVVERDGKPFVLVFPDKDYMQKEGIAESDLHSAVKAGLNEANHRLPAYMRVKEFEIKSDEFEKTPKKSIRRFKYS